MSNIIALVWDFDKTMIKGYMQEPIFKEFGINAVDFWSMVNKLPAQYEAENVRVNPDTIYLNVFIREARKGSLKGLTNERLKAFGKDMQFYRGVCGFLPYLKQRIENDKIYKDNDIRVEHYIVSTGFRQVIEGTCIRKDVEYVWGCEFIEDNDGTGNKVISEVGYSIDNTSKTRALFEINKGSTKDRGVDVNSVIPEENRRVPFKNMIYIADGPSDVPAFSVVNKYNGVTIAVFPKGDAKALAQVEKLREEGRVNHILEADFSKTSSTRAWIEGKVVSIADRIVGEKRESLHKTVKTPPKHLT